MKFNENTKKYLKKFWNASFIYFILAFGVMLIGFAFNIIFAPEPEPLIFTWKGIFMFMAICAGFGWVIHGTGFLLVKG